MEKIILKDFYSDEVNPDFLTVKNFLKWIFFNVPDCSGITGMKRIMINFCLIFVTAYVLNLFLLGKSNIFDFLKASVLMGFISGLFFIKMFSFMLFKSLETYQVTLAYIDDLRQN